MTVLSEHQELQRVIGEGDAGHISVGVKGQLHLPYHAALDIEAVYGDGAVGGACHGVLV